MSIGRLEINLSEILIWIQNFSITKIQIYRLQNGGHFVQVRDKLIKGLRPVLEGFVVTMHEGACETGSQIPRALARGIWSTVRTSPSALWQQTPTDRS